jgi:rubrerythrin
MSTQTTGTRDEHYNLVGVLYHALQAGETYEQYIRDAEQAKDSDLAKFFRDAQDQDRHRADRTEALLRDRIEHV